MKDINNILFSESPKATPVSEIVRNAENEIVRLRAENAKLRDALETALAHGVNSREGQNKVRNSLDSIAPHPLYATAPEMMIALERCQPYMNDLEGDNFDDASAGIFQDKELTLAVETLRFAIKKAKGEPY